MQRLGCCLVYKGFASDGHYDFLPTDLITLSEE